jgi:hypothetical protein
LSDQDMDSIRKLLKLNVQVDLRRVPREKPIDIRTLPDALKP